MPNRSGDRLSDPPVGVGAELVAALSLKFFDSADQANGALLNQVFEGQMLNVHGVPLGNRYNKTDVGIDHAVFSALAAA